MVFDIDASAARLLWKLRPPKVAPARVAVVVILIAILGVAHHRGGSQISLATFFVVPCALAAWTVGRNAGIQAAFTSAAVTLASDLTTQLDARPVNLATNAALRFGLYAVVAWGTHMIAELLDRLRQLSRTDALTGLANLREFNERGVEEIRRANRTQRAFSVALIDLDGFKTVNDALGHAAGDAVLKRVGAVLSTVLRDIDIPARVGGDEFAVLMPETDGVGARSAVLTLQASLRAEFARMSRPLTASIGAATFTYPPDSFEDAVKRADELMYEVKKASKNSVALKTFPAP